MENKDDSPKRNIKRDEKGRIQKGSNPNPTGRPLGSLSLVNILKKKLAEVPEGEKRSNAHKLVDKVFSKAIKDGDVTMMRDIFNRIDGMPKQEFEHSGDLLIELVKYGNGNGDSKKGKDTT